MEFKSQIDNLEALRKNIATQLQQNGVSVPQLNLPTATKPTPTPAPVVQTSAAPVVIAVTKGF